MIKAIIFDLGNVLIDFDHMIAARRISHFCAKSPQEIFSLFFESKVTTLFEGGKISPEDFFLRVKEMLKLSIGYETFVPIWNEIFFLSAKNRAVFNIANILSGHYKTAVLSNINILHFEYVKGHFPIFSVFFRVFTSCQMGLTKPDPSIYRKVLEDLDLSADEVYYTDDRKELVESAKKLGIKASVFSGSKELREDLAGAGITYG